MFKHYFELVANVEVWPIISFLIFFIFFLCLLLYVFTANKDFIKKMADLPMEDERINHRNLNNSTSNGSN